MPRANDERIIQRGKFNWRCTLFGCNEELKGMSAFLDCMFKCKRCGQETVRRYEEW